MNSKLNKGLVVPKVVRLKPKINLSKKRRK